MSAYHAIAAHFPIALLVTAFLIIVMRTFSDGPLAQRFATALSPVMSLGLLGGMAAFVIGLNIWSWEAATQSPLARNHILMAVWSLAYWAGLWFIHRQYAEKLWQGSQRYTTLLMAVIGAALVSITGTLGGSLAGNPSTLPALLRTLGWDVNTTFYLPDYVLLLIVLTSIGMIITTWRFASRMK